MVRDRRFAGASDPDSTGREHHRDWADPRPPAARRDRCGSAHPASPIGRAGSVGDRAGAIEPASASSGAVAIPRFARAAGPRRGAATGHGGAATARGCPTSTDGAPPTCGGSGSPPAPGRDAAPPPPPPPPQAPPHPSHPRQVRRSSTMCRFSELRKRRVRPPRRQGRPTRTIRMVPDDFSIGVAGVLEALASSPRFSAALRALHGDNQTGTIGVL